jgi:hypothetical protein
VVHGYTFNATHDSVADIEASGGKVMATVKLTDQAVTANGWARSAPVLFRVVPAGGPYDLVLFTTIGLSPEGTPLVHYDNVVTTSVSGDLLVRPANLANGVGDWFRF